MKSYPVYLSAGVNQAKKCLDWNCDINVIAYAANNRVVLYNPEKLCIVGVSKENHGAHINCIHWIRTKSTNKYLVTTSTEGSAKIWRYEHFSYNGSIASSPKHFVTIEGHSGSISCGYGISLSSSANESENLFIVTAGDDFCIKGWKISLGNGNVEELFTHNLPDRSLALDIIIIPCSEKEKDQHWPLVVYGGDDGNAYVLTSKDFKEYSLTIILPGHNDWVTSLAYSIEGSDIFLSTGCKDGLIRLWRISRTCQNKLPENELLYAKALEIKAPNVSVKEEDISLYCTLESVMQGHEGLLSYLDWHSSGDCMWLLSCTKTEDRSIVLWETQEEPSSGTQEETSSRNKEMIWLEKARLGEVGGNREGFFNAKFGPGGQQIVAVGYQGSLHLWNFVDGTWVPQPIVSGHFDEVVDIDWERKGRYILSVSKDRTTRLHCGINNNNTVEKWQEIARPQVHGLDLSCVTSIGSFTFVSGSEEKLLRGFSATKTFARKLRTLCNDKNEIDIETSALPEKACVPSLGLSNKADEDEDKIATTGNEEEEEEKKEDLDSGEKFPDFSDIGKYLPTENELMLDTVWSEVSKLYGHGNEVLAVASSPDGTLLASSCKASAPEDAKVIIWDAKEWKEIQYLAYHRLTVTQIEFSSCGHYLLTVSRDRSWAVFHKNQDGGEFILRFHSANLSKSVNHSRIIWSCGWVPDSLCFVTGSRDKTIALWRPVCDGDNGRQSVLSWERAAVFQEDEEVVAVAVKNVLKEDNTIIIAIGYVDGSVQLKLVNLIESLVTKSMQLDISHRKSVRRLRFRPSTIEDLEAGDSEEGTILLLASCGSDSFVLLHKIQL